MPIFEYICKECAHEFEALVQGARQAPCPSCGSTRLKKKFSGFAVIGNGPALRCEGDAPCAARCDGRGDGSCPLN